MFRAIEIHPVWIDNIDRLLKNHWKDIEKISGIVQRQYWKSYRKHIEKYPRSSIHNIEWLLKRHLKNILGRLAHNSTTLCANILAPPPVFRFLLRLWSLYITLTFHPSLLVPVGPSQAAAATRDQDGCPQR
jgi:hypothetical protein